MSTLQAHNEQPMVTPREIVKQKELYKRSKQLLGKTSDPFKGLLAHRSKPLANGHSPAELSMGRGLRTGLPMLPPLLTQNSQMLTV